MLRALAFALVFIASRATLAESHHSAAEPAHEATPTPAESPSRDPPHHDEHAATDATPHALHEPSHTPAEPTHDDHASVAHEAAPATATASHGSASPEHAPAATASAHAPAVVHAAIEAEASAAVEPPRDYKIPALFFGGSTVLGLTLVYAMRARHAL